MDTAATSATPVWEQGLLPSKIHRPARPGDAMARPRARARLDEGLHRALTAVVASAGFGKTTAVASWAVDLDPAVAVAWYAASPEDASLDVFWRYVVAALRTADPALAQSLSDLRFFNNFAAIQPTLNAVLLALGGCRREVVLVLEDFHAVMDAPDVAQGVQYLLRNLPPNAHLVVTARRPLALSLAKLRVSGALGEVGEEDLAFTAPEMRGFFLDAGMDLDGQALAQVEAVTQGWPAGCRLVAMLGDAPVPAALDRARDAMGDYLFEEVFLELVPERRDFLVATSAVDALCPSLAAAVAGVSPGEASRILEELAAGGLFVERIERRGTETWYRYHLLFLDMLRRRADLGDAGARQAARAVARDWYEAHGYLDSAVALAAEQRDYGFVRRLIKDHWKALYMADAHHVLVQWASYLPQEEILRSPFICVVLAMPYALRGDAEAANAAIMHAVASLREGEDFLFAFCMVQKAFLASFKGDAAEMRHFSDRALAFLPDDEFYLRGMMLQVQASSYSATDPLRARELFCQALAAQEPFGNKNLTCSALGNLALCCADLGYLPEARRYAQRALDLYGPEERLRKPMLNLAHLVLMADAYERGDLDAAQASYEALRGLADGGGVGATQAQALALHAKVLWARGDAQGAQEFERALALSEVGAATAWPSFAMVRSAALAREDARAAEEAPGCLRLLDLMAACCLDQVGRFEELAAFVEEVPVGERALTVRALVAAAVFAEKVARTEAAGRYLEKAVRCGRTWGLTSALRENARELEPVARRLMDASSDGSLVGWLRDLYGGEAPEVTARLTERELEAVHLVAAGMSVAEAAERLVVSRETVKKHLANVYAKLGVHSKMQAVALLREQGLL